MTTHQNRSTGAIRRPRETAATDAPAERAGLEPEIATPVAQVGASPAAAKPPPVVTPEEPRPHLDVHSLLAEIDGMDQAAFGALLTGQRAKRVRVGDRVEGRLVRIGADTALVDIGAKSEAVIEVSELGAAAREGDKVSAFVLSTGEGGIRLGRQLSGKAGLGALDDAHDAGMPVEGRVETRNTGGFTVKIGGVSAFCPLSQIDRHVAPDPDSYLGQTYKFLITDVRGRDVVVSRRSLLDIDIKERAAQIWDTIAEGDSFEGVVTSARDFGVFVDIGGVDGLVHRSELGWDSDALPPAAGATVRVRVISVDKAARKLSLTLKDEAVSPWSRVGTDFVEGEVYDGRVTRVAGFGAFISLAPGLEGMVHVSNLSEERVEKPESVVTAGAAVRVRLLSIDYDKHRLELGIKQASDAYTPAAPRAPRQQRSAGFGTMADLLGGLKLPGRS